MWFIWYKIKDGIKTLYVVPNNKKIDHNLLNKKLSDIFGKKESVTTKVVKNIPLEKNGKYRTIKVIK